MSDLDKQIERLREGAQLRVDQIEALCRRCTELFMEEGNVCRVDAPVVVCGDVHGQFYDLLQLFEKTGMPPANNFLFLGDLVDRGHHSVETLFYILALKVRFPDRVTILRGNHETRKITQVYGFYDECGRKYGNTRVWNLCTEMFDFMPVSALIEGRVFAVHGGLSQEALHLDVLRCLDRRQEVPDSGPLCDLLWSDPAPEEDAERLDYAASNRGAGCMFGRRPVDEFLHANALSFVVRSHQLVMAGFLESFDGKVVTVWSAPNYCYRFCNQACTLRLSEDLHRQYEIFQESKRQARFEKSALPDYFY